MTTADLSIKVGDGVSFGCWTDIHPGVVIKLTPKTITIAEVEIGPNRKCWPEQDFPIYLDKPIAFSEKIFHLNNKNHWISGNYTLGLNGARKYIDPSF